MKTMIYLSNTMIRFDDRSKLKADETFGIDGALVDLTLVKSRSNKANQVATLVFNQDTGFDDELSLFVMLKDLNKIKGAGAYLYFESRNDLKFSQKSFKSKIHENPELMEVFMNEVITALTAQIESQYDNINKNKELAISSVSNDILSRMNNRVA